MSALCHCCRAEASRAAAAALEVLADRRASEVDRRVAGDVASRALAVLVLPPGEAE
jgi:hypothetical protein